MGLPSLAGLDGGALGNRFSLVSSLPMSAGALVVTFVVAAGAPADEPSWDRAVRTARSMDAADVGLLAVAVLVLAVLLHPMQLRLVRLFEGYWGGSRPAAWLAALLTHRQRLARRRLAERAELDPDATTVPADAADADRLRRARYPNEPLLPTALGNALRAAEQGAGRPYGLDAVVVWPRLYPLVSDRQRAVVEDRRDQVDLAVRMSATFALVAVVTGALLWRHPTWWLVPLAASGLAVLAYRAAVAAAVAFGEALRVAFDLHRFDLLTALHLPLPRGIENERGQNQRLSTWLRQGGAAPERYHHPDRPGDPAADPNGDP
ncbi:hypothetical protein [Nonomuraea jiangxiensis]|uniref:Uncharacterized protein n=1 Tax=Nonomuraea jiangxiensis TaxID=633440 RepID=A0A1G9P5D1_9ACTN|nr:hypothetical protein [Nonomuraea jiangxiensis]SDL93996.1 hypothetical protein SAMN05421869_13340 [Nonomuraea jiangxiensis]